MQQIQKIHARQILDSRGNPTIEVEVLLYSGIMSSASVPSGASTGTHEAIELRDGDKAFGGKGVLKAVSNVNTTIADSIEGMDPARQDEIDKKLIEIDGTKNKSKLGANAILGVSLAVAHAAAVSRNANLFQHFANLRQLGFATLLPTPQFNVINGGAHADSGLDIQEFMVIPTGADTYSEALQIGVEIFHTLKKLLKEKGLVTSVGDEGGYAPHLKKNENAIELIMEAAEILGYGKKIQIGMDIAATEFYDAEKQKYNFAGKQRTAADMIDYFDKLCSKYPIVSIEDPLAEDDWENWTKLTAKLGNDIQIVGDDLLVTNIERINKAIETKAVNAVLIKLNQIGTVTETIQAIETAQKAGLNVIVSHRSGETEDTTIADLAVGLAVGQIKTGSLCRSERIAKYNQLLRIEEFLAGKADFIGRIK